MSKKRKPPMLVLPVFAVMAFFVLITGCTTEDAKKVIYTGGKIAYDSFKLPDRSSRP